MSWLGVNLNESINSLKGQITTFTRDVLTEDEQDGSTDVVLSHRQLEELKNSDEMHKQEILELKKLCAEYENKLSSSDIQSEPRNENLQKQLEQTQAELQFLREKSSEWLWDGGGVGGESVHCENSQDVAVLEHSASHTNLSDVTDHDATAQYNLNLRHKDEQIASLERKVSGLGSELQATRDENRQLLANIDELDCQQQEALDKILRTKTSLSEELSSIRDSLRNAEKEILKLTSIVDSHDNQEKAMKELLVLKTAKETECEELKKIISESCSKNDHLSEQVDALSEKISHVDVANMKLVDEANLKVALEAKIGELSNINCNLQEEIEESHMKIKDLDEEKQCAIDSLDDFKTNDESIMTQLLELKEENEILVESNKKISQKQTSTEGELNMSYKVIYEIKDRLSSKEEENLKHEAVIEARNQECKEMHAKVKKFEMKSQEQCKDFELKMSNFEKKNGELENSLKNMKDSAISKNDEIIEQLLSISGIENSSDIPSILKELNSEIALLRCQRDTFEQTLVQSRQENQQLKESIQEVELEKTELELQSEDLRDQLEEAQCLERPQPEGAVTTRLLPTIEEEDSGPTPSQVEDKCSEPGPNESSIDLEMPEHISQLNSQINALSESRRNLEVEILSSRSETKCLEQEVRDANSRLGNLHNLEAEAATLRKENEVLNHQLQAMRDQDPYAEEKRSIAHQVQRMTDQINNLTLGPELEAKDELIESQRAEISDCCVKIAQLEARLENLSDATTEELSQSLNDCKVELDKTRALIIYKDDQIDDLRQGVELVGELYDSETQDVRTLFVAIKQERTNHTKEISDMEWEMEELKTNASGTENENKSDDGEEKKDELLSRNKNLEESNVELNKKIGLSEEDKYKMLQELKSKNEELETIVNERDELVENNYRLELSNEELSNDFRESESQIAALMENENQAGKSRMEETSKELSQKQEQIDLLKEQIERSKKLREEVEEKVKLLQSEKNALLTEFHTISANNDNLSENKNKLNAENEEYKIVIMKLTEENKRVANERQQMIEASTMKHQEALSYYAEIQRLTKFIEDTMHNSSDEKSELFDQLGEKNALLEKTQEELVGLKENLATVKGDVDRFHESQKAEEQFRNEIGHLQREMSILQSSFERKEEMLSSCIQERDQLRLANRTFNEQYEEKSKEVSEFQSGKDHFVQEITRLKCHLVEIEETHTNELIEAEKRESILKKKMERLHEQLAKHSTVYSNTNHNNVLQIEKLQDSLSRTEAERDELSGRTKEADEKCIEKDESLSRLQSVLQDFQRGQSRDIQFATERERRGRQIEIDRNGEMEKEIETLKVEIENANKLISANKDLSRDVESKEMRIVSLQTQVSSIQEAARQKQDQITTINAQHGEKVDKPLLRNLLVGYFATNVSKRVEVLRVLAQVLDFSSEERGRVGLDTHNTTWLSSIANFLAPPPSNIRVASKVDVLDHTSLSQAFIRFLEDESSPQPSARLPAVKMAQESQEKAQRRSSKANAFAISSSASSEEIPGATSPLYSNPLTSHSLPTFHPVTPNRDEVEVGASTECDAQTTEKDDISLHSEAKVNLTPSSSLLQSASTTSYLQNLLTPTSNNSDNVS